MRVFILDLKTMLTLKMDKKCAERRRRSKVRGKKPVVEPELN